MNGQRSERTRQLVASYRYSVSRLEPQKRKVKPDTTARESQRQIVANDADGGFTEKRRSRPTTPAVAEKEAINKEMMQLKKVNKAISRENAKLNTNNISLERQVLKLKDALQEQPKTRHLVRTESANTTAKFSDLNKELEKTKRENMALKQDMKYARLAELQEERQANAVQLQRLRELLQQEKKASQGLRQERREMREQYSQKRHEMQDAIQKLQQELHYLRQNNQPAAERVRARSSLQMRKFEHISPATLDLKNQIQSLKEQLEKSQQQVNELRSHHQHSLKATKDEGTQAGQQCPKCKPLRLQNTKSKSKIKQLKAQVKQLSKNRVMNDEMIPPSADESSDLRKFITLRLGELGISLDQATGFLQGLDEDSTEISLLDLLGIFTAEPFGFVTDRYHYIMVFHLCLSDQQNNQNGMITIRENRTFSIESIRHNFKTFLREFKIPSQPQRKELFKKIAEFLADHNTKIRMLELLEMKGNEDEISISEGNLKRVMRDFGIDQDCIVEVMRNMVTGSPDLEHLDFRILFQNFVVEEANNGRSTIIGRDVEESRVSPNPEAVGHASKHNQQKDILFFDLDPSQLASTGQDIPLTAQK